MSREVVIVEAARTAIGRGHPEKGYYKDVHPATLLGHTYRAVIERSGIDPAEVYPAGTQHGDGHDGTRRVAAASHTRCPRRVVNTNGPTMVA